MILTSPFGRTGHMSTRTLFGAAALGSVTQEEADRTLELLVEYGINHIDTAPGYGDSELRIGPWMATYRSRFFLATKTTERTRQAARDSLHRSLERLRVDHVDLIQLHALTKPDEWEIAMGPGGALEALIEAREEGLARFIGVTGHGLTAAAMHLRSLERFDFDAVLLPCNYLMMQNPRYAEEVAALLQVCRDRNVAVQTSKSIARGPYPEGEHTHTTWYAPLEDQTAIDQAVHWVLSHPDIFLNTAGDIRLLPKVLDAANRFEESPEDIVMQELVAREKMEPLFV